MESASPGAPSCVEEGWISEQSWGSLSEKVGEWMLGKLHLVSENLTYKGLRPKNCFSLIT